MFFKKRKKKIKKQQALFTEALQEAGYKLLPDIIRIDHLTGECFYNDERYGIVFPLRFLRESKKLNFGKIYDFSFRGLYTSKREWVNDFFSPKAQITFTDHGRKIPKDFFDVTFYQEMAQSKFTLCPAGDFQWTYRFLEAIMCCSIPVVDTGCSHPQFEGFTYFFSGMERDDLLPLWNEDIPRENYKLFLKRHTLLNQFIFL